MEKKLLQAGNQRKLATGTANFDIGYHNTYVMLAARGVIGTEVPFFNTVAAHGWGGLAKKPCLLL